MGWVKLDDQFTRHPKVLAAGPLAGWLHVCALNYCAQYLTDGFVPKAAVNGLADFSSLEQTFGSMGEGCVAMDFVSDLLKTRMWVEAPGGYQIHDYLEYNPSREDVQKKRQADLERKRNADGTYQDSARSRSGNAEIPVHPVPGPVPHEVSPPQSPAGGRAAVPKPKKERVLITDQDIEELVAKYAEKFGTGLAVREVIEDSLNHVNRFKALNERRYVDGWLRRELEHRPGFRAVNGRPPTPHHVIDRTGVEN